MNTNLMEEASLRRLQSATGEELRPDEWYLGCDIILRGGVLR